MFEGEGWPNLVVVRFIRLMEEELKWFLTYDAWFNPGVTDIWEPPKENNVKINVDSSVLWDHNLAGFGAIIRDHEGAWLTGCSGNSEVTTILHVELLGIRWGLHLAWERGFLHVCCEMDCLEAFRAVQMLNFPPQHLEAALLSQIHELIHRDWSVHFFLVQRTANKCADLLAKQGALDSVGFKIWATPW